MTASKDDEQQMKQRCGEKLKTEKDPMVRMRLECLRRGANGIRGLGRLFRIMDDDGNKSLNKEELMEGLHDYGLSLDSSQVDEIFRQIDKDGQGSISFDEFLDALRGPMSERRIGPIKTAFKFMDKTGDRYLTSADLKGVYNVKHHPKYMNGEWTEGKCLNEFLKTFDTPNEVDGKVTEEEFINYYAGVSASIDDDAYFDLMMRNAYPDAFKV